jgi:hypothetical protein
MVAGSGLVGVIVVLLAAFFGLQGGSGDVFSDLQGQAVGLQPPTGESPLADCRAGADANERDDCRIVGVVNSVNAYWEQTLRNYVPARTVFFEGQVSTACGLASSETGPFYCPADRRVYVDLGFFDQLRSDFGASGGPLAQAYVIAHEYGHHISNLTGVLDRAGRDTGPQGGQVRVELQADCYAGVWVHNAVRTGFVEALARQDIADALDAAAAVGDDRIQSRVAGRVIPESFTHGSSEQRQSWLSRGASSGNPAVCDTFRGRV